MDSVVLKDLNFGYTEERIIKDLNFNLKDGELVVLVGENGSGKSTLLKLILGELEANSGHISLMGKDIDSLSNFKDLGYVPQMNVVNKIPFPISCLELVVLNLYSDFGRTKIPKKRHKEVAIKLLKDMDLEKYIHTPFNELSGGLQQRVLISRAMINRPKILILDEPTAGVDKDSSKKFFRLIQKLNREYRISVILVTHEVDTAKNNLYLDHIYKLENGGLIKC